MKDCYLLACLYCAFIVPYADSVRIRIRITKEKKTAEELLHMVSLRTAKVCRDAAKRQRMAAFIRKDIFCLF